MQVLRSRDLSTMQIAHGPMNSYEHSLLSPPSLNSIHLISNEEEAICNSTGDMFCRLELVCIQMMTDNHVYGGV